MHYHKHDPNDNESFKFKARIIRRTPNAGNTETHAYDSVKGNCVHVIVTEFLLFSVKENVTWFGSISTHLLLLPILLRHDALIPALKSSILT